MRKTFCLILVLVCGVSNAEQLVVEGLHGLGTVETHKITSEATGSNYHIIVGLPDGYDASDNVEYPTLYVLDGGVLFPIFSAYRRLMAINDEVPPMIIVAISYGTSSFAEGNMRSADFTGPSEARDYYGGAPIFQTFLEDELFPKIEGKYRSQSDRRMVFGRSIGGQFVLYTAQTRPDLFWGHIASNPAIHHNRDLFLNLRPDDTDNAASKLFVSSGSLDEPRFREPAVAWMEHWSAQSDLPWQLHTVTFEGHTHLSTPAIAFRQGIGWLFAGE
ncbi:MAG: alpha/beta hydrolase-fold protein [Pseudomonadota bacterium]